jgi:endonuclease/exonuclease/phosphatase family metal-dependent hydrolase
MTACSRSGPTALCARGLGAAAAIAALAGATIAVTPAAQTPGRWRAMTWNIAAGHGNLARIADVIRQAAPDVIALQEVDVHWAARSAFEDQAARLGALVGMDVRFGAIYQLAGQGAAERREFGLAVLSRRPIVAFTNHVIPRLSTQTTDTEPQPLPGFLDAVVDVAGARVRVFNTHLDYRADPRVRSLQVTAMLERLRAVSGRGVLMGDLNAPPAAAELAPLLRLLNDVWPNAAGAGFTYPASAPVRRIDYILTTKDITATNVRVVTTDASDHLPVVADLSVR